MRGRPPEDVTDAELVAADAFVIAAVRAVAGGRAETLPAPPPGGRWLERAAEQGVLRPVMSAMRRAGSLGPEWDQLRRTSAAIDLAQRADTLRVTGLLSQADLPAVVVKGLVLGEVVYAEPRTRDSADVDVLVAPRDLRRSVQALVHDGAGRCAVDWTQRTWARGSEVPMELGSGTVVDLHWDLVNRPRMRRSHTLPTARLLERRVRRRLGDGSEVDTLDDLDLVLHVLLHACMDGCDRLRGLLDAQQCVAWLGRRGVEPHVLAARARELGLTAPASLVLHLTAHVLGDTQVRSWAQALGSGTAWSRWVARRARRWPAHSGRSRLDRRLTRYTGPSTASSLRALLGYVVDRAVSLVVPDRPELTGPSTSAPDAHFEGYLRQVERGRPPT